jgi:mRNA-degrading endonuclease toxin of MazEF toxin-antitoxin module
MVKQGDIILVDFAPTKGREQTDYRPALVISNTRYTAQSSFAILRINDGYRHQRAALTQAIRAVMQFAFWCVARYLS